MNSDAGFDFRAVCRKCSDERGKEASFSRTGRPPLEKTKLTSVMAGQGRPFGKVYSWARWGFENPGHTLADHEVFSPDVAYRRESRALAEELRAEPDGSRWQDCEGRPISKTVDFPDGEPRQLP